MEGAEKIFREELRRLGTDHIDYYLMHMLTDAATWEKLKALGIEDWIAGKLEAGEITREDYDRWRYNYPKYDTTRKWVKVPSKELSDFLVEAFKDRLGKD